MKTLLFLLINFFFMSAIAQDNRQIAARAFQAWQKGETGGEYDSFKSLLDSNGFSLFSHPLTGLYKSAEGYQKLQQLIAERERQPNRLQFTNVKQYAEGQENFCFQFNSSGIVSGGYPYEGFNIICFSIRNGKVHSFQEYFGFIDPKWFQK